MKTKKQCPKCWSKAIGHLAAQPDATDTSAYPTERPVGKLLVESFSGGVPHGHGRLEAYICTDCGYHESYVVDPKTIRWNELYGFTWLEQDEPDGPYR
jgi:hypothetical protein